MRIGQRVRVISANNRDLIRETGTIVATRKDGYSIGVEFDAYVDGHTCSGNAQSGHGRWLTIDQLVVDGGYGSTPCEESIKQVKEEGTKPMLKTLSVFAKKHLDKDVRSFVELGYMTEGLEVTREGRDALVAFLFDANKVEMGKIARDLIAESKKSKK